jgi:segregation and condensation protein A
MALDIKVSSYEGPFDKLLELIKKNQMDIYNIPIHEITNQYIEFLREMEEMDLEIASEFIVMAATLLEIKSKMLLPKPAEEETAADSEVDPRKELIAKLIEYKKFKSAAQFLREHEEGYGMVFAKKPEIIEEVKEDKDDIGILKNKTMLDLYNLYNELINRYSSKLNENVIQREIPIDAFKIEDKMEHLRKKLAKSYHLNFDSIVMECGSKIEIVVTFLALLELIKIKAVKVIQETNFTDIYLERIENNEED